VNNDRSTPVASQDGHGQRVTELLTADAGGLARAADLLRLGRLVAFPTETVYGLGADATNPRAVAGIYAAKQRPSFNPLISHLPDIAAAEREGVFDEDAMRLPPPPPPGPPPPGGAGGAAARPPPRGRPGAAPRPGAPPPPPPATPAGPGRTPR